MSDLMIGDGEDFTAAAVQNFHTQFVFDGKPVLGAKKAVEMDGLVDGCESVFREEDDLDGLFGEKIEQVAND